ncbi:MAG: hypothetical protein AB1752_05390 [Candidatus Zixiibacteriota bacterium]
MIRAAVIGRVAPEMERFLNRYILGLEPDPDHWPAPADIGRLPVPPGIPQIDEFGSAWTLDGEFITTPIKRRTVIGAHAYRFTHNREYDCGWRLVDVTARFLHAQGIDEIDLVTVIPPPPVFSPVDALGWSAKRLAGCLRAEFAPCLIQSASPLTVHPDTVARPKIPLAEMHTLLPTHGLSLAGRRLLLLDWRWHRGRTITTVARLLARHKATVTRFTFLP